MCRRIIDGLLNLFGFFSRRQGESIVTKLDSIEKRLGRIEDKIQEPGQVYFFCLHIWDWFRNHSNRHGDMARIRCCGLVPDVFRSICADNSKSPLHTALGKSTTE